MRTPGGAERYTRRIKPPWPTSTFAILGLLTALQWGSPAMASQTDARLDALFERLARSEAATDLIRSENAIWQIWLESHDEVVDQRMAEGIHALGRGELRQALAHFDAVVVVAPEFAEVWNKRATVYWLMGALDASLQDIERTLALEPRHFGALSGLVMIHEVQGHTFEALEALEKLIRVHPKMPGLLQRIDRLTGELGESI